MSRTPVEAGSSAWPVAAGNLPRRPYIGDGALPAADPDPAALIAQSHQRCAAYGLARNEAPDFGTVGRAGLSLLLD